MYASERSIAPSVQLETSTVKVLECASVPRPPLILGGSLEFGLADIACKLL